MNSDDVPTIFASSVLDRREPRCENPPTMSQRHRSRMSTADLLRAALRLRAVLCFLTVTCASGCGSSNGPERVSVSGTVTLNGQPISEGTIAFVSQEGGRTAATPVRDGSYVLNAIDGPYVGEQKVSIQAFEKTGKMLDVKKTLPGPPDEGAAVPPEGLKIEETRQVLGPQFNSESELTANLSSGENTNVNFDLTTDELSD